MLFYEKKQQNIQKNEKPEENSKKMKKEFFEEIFQDNFEFQKVLNINDHKFLSFYQDVVDEGINALDGLSDDILRKFIVEYLNVIFILLSKRENLKLLIKAQRQFMQILKLKNASITIPTIIDFYQNNIGLLILNILNNSKKVSQIHLELLYEIMTLSCTIPESRDHIFQILLHLLNIFNYPDKNTVQNIRPLTLFLKTLIMNYKDIEILLLKNNLICIYITFFIGKNSPYYEHLPDNIKKNPNYSIVSFFDITRNCEAMIETLIYILKTKDEILYELSPLEKECLKSEHLIPFLLTNSGILISEYLALFSQSDYDYTLLACNKLNARIEDCFVFSNIGELGKLMYIVSKLTEINDQYKLNRLELLIGFPQLQLYAVNEDLFLHWYITHGNNEGKCLLLKIYEIEDPNLQAMAFLCLMHQCINNTSLFKYLFFMKSKGEKLSDGDRFLQSGLKMINRSEHNDEYMGLYTKIRSSLKKEENILNDFKGFVGNYSIVNFVKQEIELVSNDQGIIIVQIKYFTTITENKISQIVVPKNNNPQYPVKDEEKSKNGTNYYLSPNIYFKEGVFISKAIHDLTDHQKIIIEFTEADSSSHSYCTIVSFLGISSSSHQFLVNFSAKSTNTDINQINEYIPRENIINYFYPNSNVEILSIQKINPSELFSFEQPNCGLEIKTVIEKTNQGEKENSYNSSVKSNFVEDYEEEDFLGDYDENIFDLDNENDL